MRKSLCLIAALGLGADSFAIAQDTASQDLAARFGALESVSQISLSPGGNKLAYLGEVGADQAIFVVDLTTGGAPNPIVKLARDKGQLNWCRWSGAERLVCQVGIVENAAGTLMGFSRLIAVDADGSKVVSLTKDTNKRSLGVIQNGGDVIDWAVPGQPGKVLMTREYVEENTIGTNFRSSGAGLGVDLVDTITQKRTKAEAPRRDAIGYISDGRGNIRIMALQAADARGYSRSNISFSFRRQGSGNWEPLSKLSIEGGEGGGFEPVAVDSASNSVVGFDDVKGMTVLVGVSLDGKGTRRQLAGRSDVDIDQVVTIGRQRRVVGAGYATERRTIDYFDPELAALSKAMSKALPGKPNVDFIDTDDSETKLLVLAWSDTNPGMFYLLDRKTKQVEELLPVRQQMAGMKLATMRAITYKAADGTEIPAYLTLPAGSDGKGLPAIVMPHGGPGSRDEWGFDWLAQFYAARGYAVLQPNFRGSAGYGAAWYKQNGFKSWRIAVGDVNDAGRWLIAQGIAAPSKLGVVGWSYGGYAALQSAALDPDLFKAIVAIAPVTDLERLRQEAQPYSNFPQVDAFIGNGPHIREGSPAQNAGRIKAPVLLFHGTMDQNVGVGESRLMADKLRGAGKAVTYVEFPGLSHQLTNASARTRLLSESDQFLRKAFGM